MYICSDAARCHWKKLVGLITTHMLIPSCHCQAALQLGIAPEETIQGGDVEATVAHAVQLAGRRGEVVVVCGSFMIMTGARKIVDPRSLILDPIHLP